MPSGAPPSAPKPLPRTLGLVPVAIAFCAMAAWSWRKWPDVMVDFGEQLYDPWQISRGRVLYRDIGYIIGPLSQYFNAALFTLFGVSLTTLIVSNLAILAALLVLIYRLFLRASDQLTAAAICLVIVCVFSFSQYVGIGNYNYICPYSHEAFHGLALAILEIALLAAWLRTPDIKWAAAAGLTFGLVFLTKPEIFAAAAVSTAAAFLIAKRPRAKPAAVFCACAILPAIAFLLYFRSVMPAPAALHAVLGSWSVMASTPAVHNDFYKWCLGLDVPFENIALMFLHFGGAILAVAVCVFCARRGEGITPTRRRLSYLLVAALACAAWFFNWAECGRSLPLLLLGICIVLFSQRLRATPGDAANPDPARRAHDLASRAPDLWSLFALALLAKMGLHARVWHYGFCLAMPATVAVLYFTTWYLPRSLSSRGVSEPVLRATLLLLLAIGVLRLIGISNTFYRLKTYTVGQGGDRILTYSPRVNVQGWALDKTLDWLNAKTPPYATLCVFPEGIMLNYLARRPNPTPFTTLVMRATLRYPETDLLAALSTTRPDYIVLIHKDTSEWGARFFGQQQNFGLDTMRWVNQNYGPVWLLGHEPLQSEAFGIKILKRQ